MLVKFQSKAASEFVMLASHAQELLQIAGKDGAAPEGVFTAEQIPAALAALDAYSRDFDQRHPLAPEESVAQEDEEAPGAAVPMRNRAQPLMEMLRLSAEQNTFLTWTAQK
jgi:hypothetical protein